MPEIIQDYLTTFREDEQFVIRGRLTRPNSSTFVAQNVVQADLSTITAACYLDDGTVVVSPTSLTISNVIFDTVKTWDVDSSGYNFRYACPSTFFPNAVDYVVELKFTFTSGDVKHWRIAGPALAVFQS